MNDDEESSNEDVKVGRDEDTDEDMDELVPLEITSERWGPPPKKSTKTWGVKVYSQRLMTVRFDDNTTQELLAEDTLTTHGFALCEQNPFYTSVISEWRKKHAPPPRSNSMRDHVKLYL